MSTINLLSSGLDVQGTVDALISIEREPITRLEGQTTRLENRVTAYQTLNTRLSTLLDKVNNILFYGGSIPSLPGSDFQNRLSLSVFGALKASSSDESCVSVNATTGATGGQFTLYVSSLAQARTVASAGFADAGTALAGTGTLVMRTGSGEPVTINIDSTNNTLEGVRRAINAAGTGVTATIVNDGTSAPCRLLITANETGTANSFTVADNLAGGTPLGLNETVAAADARIRANGLDITKASNTVGDVIEGVTLSLKSTTTVPVVVAVGRDLDAIVAAFQELAAAYNEVNSFAKAQTSYNAKTRIAGTLSGDGTLRGIQARIREILTQAVRNDFTDYRVISQAGVSFNNDGSITIDEARLRATLEKDSNQVAALMLGDSASSDTATDSSILVNLRTALASITDPLTGPIHHATDALNQSIRRIQDQIESYEERLEARRELLTREYSRADEALRLMSVLQASLSSQLDSLTHMLGSTTGAD